MEVVKKFCLFTCFIYTIQFSNGAKPIFTFRSYLSATQSYWTGSLWHGIGTVLFANNSVGIVIFNFERFGTYNGTAFDQHGSSFSPGQIKAVELSKTSVTLYGGPQRTPDVARNGDLLGRIETEGIPQFEGKKVTYTLPSGRTEASIHVFDSANETSIDMKIRSNSSMTNNPVISSTIEFTSAPASSPTGADRPSVVMDATDMISSDMRINDTHLVYGTRGESLKLPGKLSVEDANTLKLSSPSNFTLDLGLPDSDANDVQELEIRVSPEGLELFYATTGITVDVDGEINDTLLLDDGMMVYLDNGRDVEIVFENETTQHTDDGIVHSMVLSDGNKIDIIVPSELENLFTRLTDTTTTTQSTTTTDQQTTTASTTTTTQTSTTEQQTTTASTLTTTATTAADTSTADSETLIYIPSTLILTAVNNGRASSPHATDGQRMPTTAVPTLLPTAEQVPPTSISTSQPLTVKPVNDLRPTATSTVVTGSKLDTHSNPLTSLSAVRPETFPARQSDTTKSSSDRSSTATPTTSSAQSTSAPVTVSTGHTNMITQSTTKQVSVTGQTTLTVGISTSSSTTLPVTSRTTTTQETSPTPETTMKSGDIYRMSNRSTTSLASPVTTQTTVPSQMISAPTNTMSTAGGAAESRVGTTPDVKYALHTAGSTSSMIGTGDITISSRTVISTTSTTPTLGATAQTEAHTTPDTEHVPNTTIPMLGVESSLKTTTTISPSSPTPVIQKSSNHNPDDIIHSTVSPVTDESGSEKTTEVLKLFKEYTSPSADKTKSTTPTAITTPLMDLETTVIARLPPTPVFRAAQDVLPKIKLSNEEKPLRRLGVQMAYIILLSMAALFVTGGFVMFLVTRYVINGGETYRVT